ncbi:MAG: substrate-binding domain-containing protein, partial [Chloroflexota bacterium]|nr:substrate-binding domain-containing protein [Chloroflexota bacterium]
MKKLFYVIFIAIFVVMAITGCAPKEVVEEPAVEEPEEEAEVLELALIIKATDSGFWQKAIEGGEAFDADNGDVNVTTYGPASEADVDEQLAILENVITSGADAIVIASNAGEGANAAIADAAGLGIPVLTIDTKIPSDDVVTHLA